MKKAVVILFVLAVLLGAGSYWIGLRAQAALQEQLTFIHDQYGPSFTLKHKDRGLFSSTYLYTVSYTLPPETADGKTTSTTLTIDLREKVSHGPIPFTAGSWKPALAVLDATLVSGPDAPRGFNKFLETLPELRQTSLRTIVDFSGDSLSRLVVPALKRTVAAKDGSSIALDWQGATVSCDIAARAAAIKATLDAPLFVLGHKNTHLSIQGLSLRSAAKLYGQNLYLGKSDLKLGAVQIKDGAAEVLSLADLVLEGSCERHEAVVDTWLALRGQGLAGKSREKVSLDVAMTLKNLEFTALDECVGACRRISLQPLPPEEQLRQLQAEFRTRAAALFSRNPVLELTQCALGVPAGRLETTARLAYVGTGALPDNFLAAARRFTAAARIATTEAALLDVVRLADKANAGLDGALVRQQVEAGLGELTAGGFIVRDKDKLSSRADWNGKALIVNGKTMFQAP